MTKVEESQVRSPPHSGRDGNLSVAEQCNRRDWPLAVRLLESADIKKRTLLGQLDQKASIKRLRWFEIFPIMSVAAGGLKRQREKYEG